MQSRYLQTLHLARGSAAVVLDRKLVSVGRAVVAGRGQGIEGFLGSLIIGGRDGNGLLAAIARGLGAVDLLDGVGHAFHAGWTAEVNPLHLDLGFGARGATADHQAAQAGQHRQRAPLHTLLPLHVIRVARDILNVSGWGSILLWQLASRKDFFWSAPRCLSGS